MSPHVQPGTAYAAVDSHRQDDFSPHLWRTHDYGASWTDISAGLPKTSFVAVVRADPVRAGLLYAGTDQGVFVSFDDGDHWQSLQRNLPTAWVRDLLVHGNDLIAATQGRAIWVLDDVTPLRQVSTAIARAPAHLYTPATAVRVRANENRDTPLPPETPLGKNPPAGAVIDYSLAHAAQGPVTLEIRDSSGQLVRRFSSDDKPAELDADRYFAKGWLRPGAPLSAAAGAHRFVWDLRYARPQAIEYGYSISTSWDSDTPVTPEGPMALPGTYQLVLHVDGKSYQAPLKLVMDPRETAVTQADLAAGLAFSQDIGKQLLKVWQNYGQVQAVRKQLIALDGKLAGNAAHATQRASVEALLKQTAPLVSGSGEDSMNLRAINDGLTDIASDVEGADRAPTDGQRQVVAASDARYGKARALWAKVRDDDLPKLDGELRKAGSAVVKVPALAQIRQEKPEESEDLP